MSTIRHILVANRGEIAVRVIRTAKQLGIRTTAIYSQVDASSPHVEFADDAVLIGPAPAVDSYLNIDRVIHAARRVRAQAIHPGYGFLSENADFARACDTAGLIFIGPPAEAIELMGNKAAAKRHMAQAGVGCVPGYDGEDQSDAAFRRASREIGFPIMIKAVAGGGGRGMRLVTAAQELLPSLKIARSEARSAFGSDHLILEKAIARPRHVEIQVLADNHGGVLHLGERDCSLQRRHQKVIEESPCPVLSEDQRRSMGATAVLATRSIGYRGVGTMEFLLDADGDFYFLEMNTRLQVEHPVTELVTGLDLVELQIRVAEGQPLTLNQSDIYMRGHAIEARLYAEDPEHGFMPSTGCLETLHLPQAGGVRVDSGVRQGQQISPYYDPLMAKIIAHAATRELARCRLIRALQSTTVLGVKTNKEFLVRCLEEPRFIDGHATTSFIEESGLSGEGAKYEPTATDVVAAAVLRYLQQRSRAQQQAIGVPGGLLGWSHPSTISFPYRYLVGQVEFNLEITPASPDSHRVRCNGAEHTIVVKQFSSSAAQLEIDGIRSRVFLHEGRRGQYVASVGEHSFELGERSVANADEEVGGGGRIVAPMPGIVLEIFVQLGERVESGARLAVLEAMKMHHEIVSSVSGIVEQLSVSAGAQVALGDLLIRIGAAEPS